MSLREEELVLFQSISVAFNVGYFVLPKRLINGQEQMTVEIEIWFLHHHLIIFLWILP